MAKIKKLSKEEYEEKLYEQDMQLGEGDEYLEDDGYYEDGYEEGYDGDGYYEDGSYEEDGEYYEDGSYEDDAYAGEEEYSEDGEYDDEEYYDEDGGYDEDGYYDDASGEEDYDGAAEEAYDEAADGGAYGDDDDLEYLDEEEFYDENGLSLGTEEPYYDPLEHYEEIEIPGRRRDANGNIRRSTNATRAASTRRSTASSRAARGGYSTLTRSGSASTRSGSSASTRSGSASSRGASSRSGSASTRSGTSSQAGGSRKKRSLGARIWGVVWRVLVFLLVTVVLLLIFCYGAVKLILLGPSSAMSTQYVSTFHETSALKWLPGVFLSDEEVEAILAKNMMPEAEVGTVSDKDLIVIDETPKEDVEPIVVEEIFGPTYHGYMMIVQDPSTVYLGVLDQFAQTTGWIVPQFAEKYGAIGGVNGGEFVDMGSYSYTAMPVGGVISRGQGLHENNGAGAWNLVCMTNENKLLLLKGYSVKAAMEMGVRDGCHVRHETGPFLIIDGEPLEVPDTEVYGGGKNPRTAIGQRSDGVMLLCVVDGRQASSLGATFKDMIDIMRDYGAVNAACLDGGTSTQMYYDGEIVNNPYSPTGPRRCPTAWLVGGGN